MEPYRDGPHMLREIYAQPETIREVLRQHWGGEDGGIRFDRSSLSIDELRACTRVMIAASGASRHAGLMAQVMIEELAGIPVSVEFASEFCNRRVAPGNGAIALFITQSGETGDTAAAQRAAREAGYRTIAITNVVDSTIARQADAVIYTWAGVERAIPATKSFTAQLAAIYLLALLFATGKGRCSRADLLRRVDELSDVADKLESSLPQLDGDARAIASVLHSHNQWVLLGRGVHHPVALEGTLKLMETAYITASAFPAGEFRHGPAAVLDGSQVVVGAVCHDRLDKASVDRYRKSLEVIDEIAAVTGILLLIGSSGDSECARKTSNVIQVPATSELLSPLIETVALQLLAYHIAQFRGLDVDHPRNLVKSVQAD